MECFLLVSLYLHSALEGSDTIDASCIFTVRLRGRVYQNIKSFLSDKGLIYDEIQEPSLAEISIFSLSDSENAIWRKLLIKDRLLSEFSRPEISKDLAART